MEFNFWLIKIHPHAQPSFLLMVYLPFRNWGENNCFQYHIQFLRNFPILKILETNLFPSFSIGEDFSRFETPASPTIHSFFIRTSKTSVLIFLALLASNCSYHVLIFRANLGYFRLYTLFLPFWPLICLKFSHYRLRVVLT